MFYISIRVGLISQQNLNQEPPSPWLRDLEVLEVKRVQISNIGAFDRVRSLISSFIWKILVPAFKISSFFFFFCLYQNVCQTQNALLFSLSNLLRTTTMRTTFSLDDNCEYCVLYYHDQYNLKTPNPLLFSFFFCVCGFYKNVRKYGTLTSHSVSIVWTNSKKHEGLFQLALSSWRRVLYNRGCENLSNRICAS